MTSMNRRSIVDKFLRRGCGCQTWNGRQCSIQFSIDHVQQVRASCLELTHNELDMAILGQLAATTHTSDKVVQCHHAVRDRKRSYTTHYHQGLQVCSNMFRFLHTVGIK